NVDSFVPEQLLQGCRDILILAIDQAWVMIYYCDSTPEPAHRLCKLCADKSASQNEEMFRNIVKLQCFDMRQRFRLSQAGSGNDGRMSAHIYDHPLAVQAAYAAISRGDFDGPGSDKTSGAPDQFRAALFVKIELHFNQALD